MVSCVAQVIPRLDADVAVVGYGPTGMTLAALLGGYGHRVVVLERYAGLYNLPRAGVFDDETMRTWDALGIAESLLPGLTVTRTYGWLNGAGDILAEFDCAEIGRSGWAEFNGMYQPDLERALDGVCRSCRRIDIRHGTVVTGIEQSESCVALVVEGPDGTDTVTVDYVVACDGGKSFVREHLGIEQDDYGFGEAWLVCDFRLNRKCNLPSARQVCDPRQPTAVISLGPRHHRLSFMMESERDFVLHSQPEQVWAKAVRYLDPADAELIRVGGYTFRSLVARRWRIRRVLLAGDAAHQMPPFLGQGMCSGVRDAQNLAFKLDLVLRSKQSPELLDTYQAERDPHVRTVIERGIELGRIQTERNSRRAAERDRLLLAQRASQQASPKLRPPGITSGFLAKRSGSGRGELSVQAFVDAGRGRSRMDTVIGHGFQFLATADLMSNLERTGIADRLNAVGVHVAGLASDDGIPSAVVDVDRSYGRWFDELGCVAVAVRRDFYVFGTAVDLESALALSEDLISALDASQCAPTLVGH
jgi:2-polyprenyl-6-methoxyphenol hydroxylase-like FAD-dependent oxidoreductase